LAGPRALRVTGVDIADVMPQRFHSGHTGWPFGPSARPIFSDTIGFGRADSRHVIVTGTDEILAISERFCIPPATSEL
jgi:hypothetical protein